MVASKMATGTAKGNRWKGRETLFFLFVVVATSGCRSTPTMSPGALLSLAPLSKDSASKKIRVASEWVVLDSRNDGVVQPTNGFMLMSRRSEEVARASNDVVPGWTRMDRDGGMDRDGHGRESFSFRPHNRQGPHPLIWRLDGGSEFATDRSLRTTNDSR
ncbi:hypothetical protein EDD21DRAFT_59387 [Dissophora ornata]|nr:hypothetical protein EDD21DRAFT_59387 [Dissophora ornata]